MKKTILALMMISLSLNACANAIHETVPFINLKLAKHDTVIVTIPNNIGYSMVYCSMSQGGVSSYPISYFVRSVNLDYDYHDTPDGYYTVPRNSGKSYVKYGPTATYKTLPMNILITNYGTIRDTDVLWVSCEGS